jgi:hypothetical protein
MNVGVRVEKPFQKIPKFSTDQIIVKSKITKQVGNINHSSSKRITVTKLLNQVPLVFDESSPYIPKFEIDDEI